MRLIACWFSGLSLFPTFFETLFFILMEIILLSYFWLRLVLCFPLLTSSLLTL
jgi:hypothetical protein